MLNRFMSFMGNKDQPAPTCHGSAMAGKPYVCPKVGSRASPFRDAPCGAVMPKLGRVAHCQYGAGAPVPSSDDASNMMYTTTGQYVPKKQMSAAAPAPSHAVNVDTSTPIPGYFIDLTEDEIGRAHV